jgi:RNA polymerase sigma-70 factor (ECF subfamily)
MIMRLVQQGDTDALGHLFDRYSSLIEKIAVRILRDIFEAQDLVQDVFFYVYRKSHIFDPARGPLGSWLVQIAYTRAFTRRDQLKRRDLNDCARIEELADSANADISLQRLVEELSAKDLIERAFVHLTPLQQRTLQLYFFEGYSLREISSHLKQSLSNTRHHYYRGIEKMKEVLESPCVVSVAKKDEN